MALYNVPSSAAVSHVQSLLSAAGEMVRLLLLLRPDVKFVEDSMVRVAIIFLGGIQTSEVARVAFLNSVLTGYFLDFFTMRWGYMRMRFDFFEKIFHERLPHLFEHFSLLNITSDMYFRSWLLTGFSRVLNIRSLLRVWDGFLLLGEAHFFSVALALLTLLEHALMTQGFAGCIDILTNRKLMLDKNKLFYIVYHHPVPASRHAAWISTQQLAEQKQTLYDLLLV
jgi:hypothetical protein